MRAALCLLIGAWASSVLFTGTMAKYVAAGIGSEKARYASFSFVTITDTFGGIGGEEEIVTQNGISSSHTFSLPLFDTEYFSAMWATSGDKSVVSNSRGPIVAPGVGHAWGPLANNTNYLTHQTYGAHGNGGIYLRFHNKSEVKVRFRIDYLGSSTLAEPMQGARFDIRPCTIPSSSLLTGGPGYVDPQWFSLDTSDHEVYDWIELEPNESTTSSVHDPKRVGIAWAWRFQDDAGLGVFDAHDTYLGENRWNEEFNVQFRITVEQID